MYDDLCIIDDEYYFIRGCIELPVMDANGSFIWDDQHPCPETINLKTIVHTRPAGAAPYIELEPTEHPLALKQKNGISKDRIKQIAEELCQQDEQH